MASDKVLRLGKGKMVTVPLPKFDFRLRSLRRSQKFEFAILSNQIAWLNLYIAKEDYSTASFYARKIKVTLAQIESNESLIDLLESDGNNE